MSFISVFSALIIGILRKHRNVMHACSWSEPMNERNQKGTKTNATGASSLHPRETQERVQANTAPAPSVYSLPGHTAPAFLTAPQPGEEETSIFRNKERVTPSFQSYCEMAPVANTAAGDRFVLFITTKQ